MVNTSKKRGINRTGSFHPWGKRGYKRIIRMMIIPKKVAVSPSKG